MITVRNNFHNTEARIHPKAEKQKNGTLRYFVTKKTAQRVRRALCGISDCQCSGEFGERGPQEFDWEYRILSPSYGHDGYYIIDEK